MYLSEHWVDVLFYSVGYNVILLICLFLFTALIMGLLKFIGYVLTHIHVYTGDMSKILEYHRNKGDYLEFKELEKQLEETEDDPIVDDMMSQLMIDFASNGLTYNQVTNELLMRDVNGKVIKRIDLNTITKQDESI
jgi:hypothetical protein